MFAPIRFLCAGISQKLLEFGLKQRLFGRRVPHQQMVGADPVGVLDEAQAAGGIRLRSQSTSSVFTSAAANDAARLMAVVVFPTPPF